MTKQTAKLLSVVGPGRSGTTVLGEILGEVPDAFDVGELRWIWRRGLLEGRRCGCGTPLPECPFWSEVLDRVRRAAVADGDSLRIDAVVELQRRIGLRRERPRVLAAAPAGSRAPEALRGYTAVMASVYAAVRQVSGAHLTVDTSKRAVDAAVANRVLGHEHYLLHVVRDPRAVAYSWKRVKANPSSDQAPVLGRRSTLSSSTRWVESTLGAEVLRRRLPPGRSLFLRYEDFARRPAATIREVLAFLGEDPDTCPVSETGLVSFGGNHTVAGNPDRFRTGAVAIREDVAWRDELAARDRLAVEVVTAPLLRRYGYPLHRA